MKLDITKTNIKHNNCSGLPFEIQFLKDIKEGHSCLRLLNPLRHQARWKRKRCHLKSDYPILTSDAFLNQKHNKQTSHGKQKTLDSSCISFCTSSRNITSWHKSLSASAVRVKQLSRCCINFSYELTCQILTNQSMKIGRSRAWSVTNAWSS